MVNVGIVFGRFQILHLGHMEYLAQAKKMCKHLIIGISNSDPWMGQYDVNCPHRSELLSNPLTFFERLEMIKGALIENGINLSEFTIVPLPINYPERIKYYIPFDGTFIITIYDKWGEKRKQILDDLGYKILVLWTRHDSSRITSGTEIRNKILKGEEWKHLVSETVFDFITENKIDLRIRNIAEDLKSNK